MTDSHSPVPPASASASAPGSRRLGLKIALVGAGIAAGALGATAFGASAASTSSSPAPSYGSTAQAPPTGQGGTPDGTHSRGGPGGMGGMGGMRGPGGAAPVRPDEKSVSTDVAAKLKAAALAKVPGATVVRVETDSGDAAYEAHLTKADGSVVTVKFDKNYAVTAVENGMGR